MPEALHEEVRAAFRSLHARGCLFRDLVRVQGKDVLTPVSRLLIGNPGCTYKYLNTRLFTVPWPVTGSDAKYREAEIAAACQTFLKLNGHLQAETVQAWEQLAARERADVDAVPVCIGPDFPRVGLGAFDAPDEADIRNRSAYNVTLLNFMDPQKMPYLKEEPYFGMGKMAVSWHHDENLVERSAVAVYSHSFAGTARPPLPARARLRACARGRRVSPSALPQPRRCAETDVVTCKRSVLLSVPPTPGPRRAAPRWPRAATASLQCAAQTAQSPRFTRW